MKEGLDFVSALLGLATALVSMIAIRRTKVAAAPAAPPMPVYQPGPPAPTGPATFSFDTFLRADAPAPNAPTGPPPPFAPPPSTPRRSQAVVRSPVWAALRDAGLIFFASAALGVLVGLADPSVSMETVGLLSIVCLLVGFTISAVRAGERRWPHLGLVALASWVFSLVNVLLGLNGVGLWLLAAMWIIVCAAVAGGIATLIARRAPLIDTG